MERWAGEEPAKTDDRPEAEEDIQSEGPPTRHGDVAMLGESRRRKSLGTDLLVELAGVDLLHVAGDAFAIRLTGDFVPLSGIKT